MSDIVIKADGLSKRYFINHQGAANKSGNTHHLSEMLQRAAMAPLRLLSKKSHKAADRAEREEFWALKDVSLEIRRGEVIGIIGRNGAGKSTLLKILSRITKPTAGEVRINGRVASLLEVGTGFHPELTGRENIFLNGAILGLARHEIVSKFDAIVNFSGVEKFLDVPVKRYSSGMATRLGFAVAAHLEEEILIVDEVLAVGDAEFQSKCLGKMNDLASKEGRTVLFVSHNIAAVELLCSRIILLHQGKIACEDSDKRKVITQYLDNKTGDSSKPKAEWTNTVPRTLQSPFFTPFRFWLSDHSGTKDVVKFANDDEVWLHIEGFVENRDPSLSIGYALYNANGHALYWSFLTDNPTENWVQPGEGPCHLLTKIPYRLLNEGHYRLELAAGLLHRKWLLEPSVNAPAIFFEIQGGISDSVQYTGGRPTLLAPIIEWKRS